MTFIAMIIVTMRRSPLIIMTAGPPGRQGAAAGVGRPRRGARRRIASHAQP